MADGFLEKRAQDLERRKMKEAARRRARWQKSLRRYRESMRNSGDAASDTGFEPKAP